MAELPGTPQGVFTTAYDSVYERTRPIYFKSYGGRLYWTTFGTGELWTSGLHGEDAHVLLDTVVQEPRGIAFHGDHVYWSTGTTADIYRANLDGTDIQRVVDMPGGDYYTGIDDLEIYDGRFYWTPWSGNSVRTCRLDGSDYYEISLAAGGRAFCVEIQNDSIYVGVYDVGPEYVDCLLRYSMDGSTYDLLAQDRHVLSMDVFEDRIYYNCELSDAVYSCLLTGGEERMEYEARSWQLAVVPEPASIAMTAAGAVAFVLAGRKRRGRHRN